MPKFLLPCFLAFLLPLGCASIRAAKPAGQVASVKSDPPTQEPDSQALPQSSPRLESHPPSRSCHGSKFRFK